jgi:hypothetical protein
MRSMSERFTRSRVAVAFVLAALGSACTGVIDEAPAKGGGPRTSGAGGTDPGSPGAGGSGTGGPGTGGSGAPTGGAGGGTGSPTLAQIADQYFPGRAPANLPKRVFRLTRTQLDITTKTLLPAHVGGPSAVATLPRDPLQTNYEYSDHLGFNPANFTPYTNWVTQVANSVKATPATVIDCAATNNAPTCLADQAKKFVSKAFRGTTEGATLTRYADFFTTSVATYGLPAATAELVDLTLSSPSYVFRDEVSTDTSSALLPAHQLQNLTYSLADAPPETVGLSSATPGPYLQASAIDKTIDQVLASPQARAKLIRFFIAWLEIKEPDEFTIAPSVFPEFTPAVAGAVVNETKTFLERQLSAVAPKMKDVTESTQSFVSSASAFLYGRAAPATPGFLDLDPTQRLGVFTQPAVLASHSGPTTSRLVKRGVFFTRKLMCLPLGAPPPDLDTTVPPMAGATERQTIEAATANAKCAGCHTYINPFGFSLENYDAIGRWRTTDQGKPIDPSVAVGFFDEGKLSVATPVDALKAFTRSLRFQQCFARQLFRFYTGRDETPGDDPLLRKMFFDFASDNRQDILGMLRTLASAPTFARRSEAP